VVVPAGTRHNFSNSGDGLLRLLTIYAPPDHAPDTVHRTKAEAKEAEKSGQDVPPPEHD
jgi:mannose-6-phosphate isomerase-like protein (cupin superfamily)